MKYVGLAFAMCALAAAPVQAFEVQGENATLENGAGFVGPNPFLTPDLSQGNSLALPYIGKADSEFLTDYGNAIAIPAPGVDKPAPAWALPR